MVYIPERNCQASLRTSPETHREIAEAIAEFFRARAEEDAEDREPEDEEEDE